MKNLLLLLLFLLSQHDTFSQKVYFQVGPTLSSITETNNGSLTEQNSSRVKFNAGANVVKKLSTHISIESGLLMIVQACSSRTQLKNGSLVRANFSTSYLQIPVNLLYHFAISETERMFFNAGPYVAFGIGGKTDGTSERGTSFTTLFKKNVEFENSQPFISSEDNSYYYKLRKLDYGLNLGLGVNFAKALIKLNVGLGIANINAAPEPGVEDNNKFRTLSVSAGFPLNGRK